MDTDMRTYGIEFSETRERRFRARTILVGFVIVLALLAMAFSGCSHVSKVASAESNQASALLQVKAAGQKVEKDHKDQFAEIANLASEQKMLLSLPETDQTKAAIGTLADTTLSLAGAPSENETRLEAEVQSLLAGGEKQTEEINRLNGIVTALKNQDSKDVTDKQKAEAKVTSTTTTLYQVAMTSAESADYSASIFQYVFYGILAIGILVLFWFGIRVADHFSEAAVTVAAKAP